MANDTQYLDGFIDELLHVNETGKNKLVDLGASGGKDTFYLDHLCAENLSEYTVEVIKNRIGRDANTILLGSALSNREQSIGNGEVNTFTWKNSAGVKSPAELDAFITNAYKDIKLRGNNPMFLSIGILKWKVSVRNDIKEVHTPVLIFPVQLIRSGNKTQPVAIEFVDDDIYVNPCLISRLKKEYGETIAEGFPKVNGAASSPDDPVNFPEFAKDKGAAYFRAVKNYIDGCRVKEAENADTLFSFDQNVVAISLYKHDELCTYYDIKRNHEKIYKSPLVSRVFKTGEEQTLPEVQIKKAPKFILPRDHFQEQMISEVVNGESMIIKGPPGTGKTLTIANMIAALMAEGKSVLFISKKISALEEVNAKLPEPLRKFVMLLESETENSGARINPRDIKIDFKRLIQSCKEYTPSATLDYDLTNNLQSRTDTFKNLRNYVDVIFNNALIADDNLYNAMDIYCRIEAERIPFITGAQAIKVNRVQLNAMTEGARVADGYFIKLTSSRKHSISKNAWYGVKDDVNSVTALNGGLAIRNEIYHIIDSFNKIFEGYPCNVMDFRPETLSVIVGNVLTDGQIKKIVLTPAALEACGDVEKKLNAYLAVKDEKAEALFPTKEFEGMTENLLYLGSCKTDGKLTIAQVKNIYDNVTIFKTASGAYLSEETTKELIKILNDTAEIIDTKNKLFDKACGYFDSAKITNESVRSLILEARPALKQYVDSKNAEPATFDFRGKRYARKLSEFALDSNLGFAKMVEAVENFWLSEESDKQIKAKFAEIYSKLTKKLTNEQMSCLMTVLKNLDDACNVGVYLDNIIVEHDKIVNCANVLGTTDDHTIDEIRRAYDSGAHKIYLAQSVDNVNWLLGIEEKCPHGEVESVALSFVAVSSFLADGSVKYLPVETTAEIIIKLHNADKQISMDIARMYMEAAMFAEANCSAGDNDFKQKTFAELKVYADEVSDGDNLSAMLSYQKVRNKTIGGVSMKNFYEAFENDLAKLPEGVTYKDMLEHSFYGIALDACFQVLNITKNLTYRENIERYRRVESELDELNLAAIERICSSGIKENDPDFTFINANRASENLRLMFKRQGRGILKLKKCMIMSPYLVSLLFRPEKSDPEVYENFDVLIVDEASQMEPALILPGLFRAKQCVIVGDEHQMPPIKHFEEILQGTYVPTDQDDFNSLEPEISVLSLALQHNAFKTRELICHYRSRTESLIAYSQKNFYPTMRTFPTRVPKIEPSVGVKGLGIKDIYVPDGDAQKGENLREAEVVVAELKKHFENYFKDGVLTMSVGVVAFGISQVNLITSLVEKDKDLSRRITEAKTNFNDVPEKLIFFKAIEQIQGQETEHMILSLTYGKRGGKIYQHFGTLNQGRLGKNIFNVAVTRAQSMITVIHSVRAGEITNSSIKYIGDYLATAESFAFTPATRLASSESTDSGFINSVAEFITSGHISRDRVVFDYGVSSIKIPLVILSEDKEEALLGIWCEKNVGNKFNYIDYNVRYIDALSSRGWDLYKINIYDWVTNRHHEKERLAEKLSNIE